MIVQSHIGEESTSTRDELMQVLSQREHRHGGEFWIANISGGFSGEFAHVIWFPSEGHPGFRCIRNQHDRALNGESTVFVWDACDPADGEIVPNEFVLGTETALLIANKFFESTELPEGHEWFEL